MLTIIPNENSIAFDCDDTIIMWNANMSFNHNAKESVCFICPYDGKTKYYLRPHYKHIEYMKQEKAAGKYIIVWSAGGYKWAKTVVETLGLQDIVDVVMEKPNTIVDDLTANEIFYHRIYIPYNFYENRKKE